MLAKRGKKCWQNEARLSAREAVSSEEEKVECKLGVVNESKLKKKEKVEWKAVE